MDFRVSGGVTTSGAHETRRRGFLRTDLPLALACTRKMAVHMRFGEYACLTMVPCPPPVFLQLLPGDARFLSLSFLQCVRRREHLILLCTVLGKKKTCMFIQPIIYFPDSES